ncbi:MAG TPA: hypothetical protein VLT87_10950 [Thermoanaerobaculia bacterium]|nr:hypothetical protein [Thermoanaerobaculia bacterium]
MRHALQVLIETTDPAAVRSRLGQFLASRETAEQAIGEHVEEGGGRGVTLRLRSEAAARDGVRAAIMASVRGGALRGVVTRLRYEEHECSHGDENPVPCVAAVVEVDLGGKRQ